MFLHFIRRVHFPILIQCRMIPHFWNSIEKKNEITRQSDCPVSWGYRIHRLLLCRGVRPTPTPQKCPGYDTKKSDEVPVILELWGMWCTPSLLSLPGPLWPGVVAPDKGPIYGLNRTKLGFLHYTDFCI